jgi:hypothetical protein
MATRARGGGFGGGRVFLASRGGKQRYRRGERQEKGVGLATGWCSPCVRVFVVGLPPLKNGAVGREWREAKRQPIGAKHTTAALQSLRLYGFNTAAPPRLSSNLLQRGPYVFLK